MVPLDNVYFRSDDVALRLSCNLPTSDSDGEAAMATLR